MIRKNNDDTLRYLIEILKRYSPETLLDLGSGSGEYHKFLSLYTKTSTIDINHLSNDVKAVVTNHTLHNLDVFPYPNVKPADIVIALDVLEHLYNIEAFIENLHNLTKNLIFLSVPNIDAIDDKLNNISSAIYDPDLKEKTSYRWTPEHIRHFNVNSLIKLLERHNFEILEISGSNYGASVFGTLIMNKFSEKFKISKEDVLRALGETIVQFAPNISILARRKI